MKNITSSDSDLRDFILTHKNDEPASLLLKFRNKSLPFDLACAARQIECRQRFGKKLEWFLKNNGFMFPDPLSGEQASHQAVAAYHSSLIGSGNCVLDMTAGLGIDAISLALNGNMVTACELIPERVHALSRNGKLFLGTSQGTGSLEVIEVDSEEIIHRSTFDAIFIDPARRDAYKKRTYAFSDCQPDILPIQKQLLASAPRIFIKASPMLDIKQTCRDLACLSELHVVSVEGECKEILAVVEKNAKAQDLKIYAVELDRLESGFPLQPKIKSRIVMKIEDIGSNGIDIAEEDDLECGSFIYDPSSAVHKLHPCNWIEKNFKGMKRLSPNTDLYISAQLHESFPGRIFRIKTRVGKNELRNLKARPRNVIARNYPIAAEEVRRKYGLDSGTSEFIIGCRIGKKEKAVIVDTSKIVKGE